MLEFPDSPTTKYSDDTFLANDNGNALIFLIEADVAKTVTPPFLTLNMNVKIGVIDVILRLEETSINMKNNRLSPW